MSTPSLEYLNNVWQYLPQGHEKPLKQAFYNTIANIFIVLAGAVSVAVYFILAPFIRPLYWALLCGNFLYPFKRSLTNVLRQWLKGLQDSGTPFAVGMILLPLKIANTLAESMTMMIWANIKLLFGIAFAISAMYILYHFIPLSYLFDILCSFLNFLYDFVEYFNSYWVWTLLVGHLLCVIFLWKPESTWLRWMSAPVWVSVLLHLANIAGPLKVPLFFFMVIVMVAGVVVQMGPSETPESASGGQKSPSFCSVIAAAVGLSKDSNSTPDGEKDGATKVETKTATLEESPIVRPPETLPAPKPLTLNLPARPDPHVHPIKTEGSPAPKAKADPSVKSPAGDTPPPKSIVDQSFTALLWGHVIVRLWMHLWIISLLFMLPLLHVGFKKIVQQFKPNGMLHGTAQNAKASISQWFETRQQALMPQCLRGLGSLLSKGDRKIISILEQGLDQATSILFILMLLVGTFLFSIIGAVQIQRESMYMITTTQNVLNNTVNSELSEWMPNAEELKKTMDQVLQKTHEHGRNFISNKVHEFLPVDGSDEEKDNVVNQVLDVWDKLYASMLTMNEKRNQTSSSQPVLPSDMDTLMSMFYRVKDMLQISAAVEFVKANLGMFMSVLESVWAVLKGNMSLLMTVITSIVSALLGGGTAILNFVISAIIFLTTLFYLLASSGEMYKPAELFCNMSPGSTGNRFGQAVEKAISGVFKASLKMATFYGLYTWLIHLVFGLDIIFIPSALAAVFAAIPFLGPYWAAVPAVIDLWLVKGQGLNALLLFVAHMMPAYVVDTAIYREIEGGHPYVTGLAIAGGILFMGLEGAIIGPIILCCLIVVVNMYSSMLQTDPTTPNPVMWPKRLRSVSSDSFHVH
ncbi:transmembrane protein 245-like isoform X2 [Physella acuta]|uniref:transmembrane protein 245-like isoform X2 n=1 Tax=Physella acuta TaxID=109671 RepID=UPI0027DC9B58|nr:transmembrane protein 245-like isoform X2 [Physella acuta]